MLVHWSPHLLLENVMALKISILIYLYYVVCESVFLMCVYTTCEPGARGGREKPSYPLELKLGML